MPTSRNMKTVVSTKGQVILPKAVRIRRGWTPGTELVVEESGDGVVLKLSPAFAQTRPEDVFGSLCYRGPAKSIAEMDAAVAAEAKRRHARHRH